MRISKQISSSTDDHTQGATLKQKAQPRMLYARFISWHCTQIASAPLASSEATVKLPCKSEADERKSCCVMASRMQDRGLRCIGISATFMMHAGIASGLQQKHIGSDCLIDEAEHILQQNCAQRKQPYAPHLGALMSCRAAMLERYDEKAKCDSPLQLQPPSQPCPCPCPLRTRHMSMIWLSLI